MSSSPRIVYDTGVLLAAERGDHRAWGRHYRYLRQQIEPVVPAPVVVQSWRRGRRQATLARLLKGVVVPSLDATTARAAGELCGVAGSRDVTDAVVAVVAARAPSVLITSDPDDLSQLLAHLPQGRWVELLTV